MIILLFQGGNLFLIFLLNKIEPKNNIHVQRQIKRLIFFL